MNTETTVKNSPTRWCSRCKDSHPLAAFAKDSIGRLRRHCMASTKPRGRPRVNDQPKDERTLLSGMGRVPLPVGATCEACGSTPKRGRCYGLKVPHRELSIALCPGCRWFIKPGMTAWRLGRIAALVCAPQTGVAAGVVRETPRLWVDGEGRLRDATGAVRTIRWDDLTAAEARPVLEKGPWFRTDDEARAAGALDADEYDPFGDDEEAGDPLGERPDER